MPPYFVIVGKNCAFSFWNNLKYEPDNGIKSNVSCCQKSFHFISPLSFGFCCRLVINIPISVPNHPGSF
jgi:hypothetical protein